jgi:dihydrofolate reductase
MNLFASGGLIGHVGKLIYSMNPSLDGYIAGPGGEISAGAPSEEVHRVHNQHIGELAVHLCGRRLYEVMTYWDDFAEREPDAPDYELEFARIWCALPKIVFSNTLTEVGPNATLASEDLAATIGRLKEAGGDIAVGGAELAGECIRLGLVDEFRLFVTPFVIGGGTPYFPKDVELDLRLAETHAYESGTVYLRYERADAG